MSQENVDTFRRGIKAFNQRSAEGMMAECDPAVECKPLLAGVTDTPYVGEEGIRDFLAATDEAFERFELHTERLEDHGDYVLAVNTVQAKGRASGVEITRPLVQIARLSNGKIVWWQTFRTVGEALEAVGLSE